MKNIEIINILNLIVIFCIPIISFNIYKIKKDTSLINLSIILTIEILISLFVLKSDKFYYAIIIIFTLKSMLFVKNYINIFFIVLMFLVSFKNNEVVYLLNLILNLYINKMYIIDSIKKINIEYIENKSRLKNNINHKETLKEMSKNQFEKQIEYKDYVFELNKKIAKTITESQVPIFLLDFDKNLLSYNAIFENLIKDDYMNIKKLNIKNYFEFKFKNYEEAIKKLDDKSPEDTIILETKSGKVYKFTYLLDKIDEKVVFICTLKDVTQTNIIQNRLRESEEKYKKLMDVLDEGILIVSNNELEYINEKGTELFNLKSKNSQLEEIISNIKGKNILEFKKSLTKIESELNSKSFLKLETKNNKFLEIIFVNMKISDKLCALIIVMDVTELENTLLNIKESEKTYKLLIQTLPEGIIILDKTNKNEIYKNESSNNLIEIIGENKLKSYIEKYIKEDEFGVFKKFSIDKDKNLDITLAIIDRKEENTYVVIFRTLDYEYKIKNIKNELKKVEKDNKFKTDLMVSIANDIKKPLDVINSYNKEISKYKNQSEHTKNYTKLLSQNTNRLIRLINNINEVSLDNNYIIINKQECNICDLVENLILKSKNYIEKNNLNYNFIKNVNNEIVNIDIDKIERIILNILSNAIKYTKNGNITISINEYENEIGVSIKDTGIGIQNDKLDKIFMNFEQLDTTLSRGCEGTGVGLAVVKRLLDAHEIPINIKSEENVGSEFEILIPKSNNQMIYENDIIFASEEKVDIEYSDIYLNF